MEKLKISIVTPSFNQGEFIEETILSVINQGYENLEYIVIDGASSDNSADVIKKYEDKLAYWVSEKDNGQTHAINKGFERATGDVIAWLNSDDVYCDDAFNYVASYFSQNPDCMILAGNILFMKENGKIYARKYPNSSPLLEKYAMMSIYQPSIFIRQSILSIIGYPKEEYKLMMDHEWFSKIVKRFPVHIVDRDISKFRWHSASKSSNNNWTPQYILEKKLIAKQVFPKLDWVIEKFPIASVAIWLKLERFLRMIIRIKRGELKKCNDKIV